MSYDAIEKSTSSSAPFELYLFSGQGISFALTSADAPITYSGQIYNPTTISRTEIDQSQEMNSGEMKISLPKSHALAQLFIPYLPASPISLIVFGGHFGDSEIVVIFSGEVASTRYTEQCELQCTPEQTVLKRKIPSKMYQSGCPHVFGSDACGVGLPLYTYAGSVQAIDSTGSVLTIGAFGSTPKSLKGGYFKRGNDVRMIVDHSGSSITLIAAIAGLSIGDGVSGVAGCAHTYADCLGFSNVANFLGFDLIPARNPFDGSLE